MNLNEMEKMEIAVDSLITNIKENYKVWRKSVNHHNHKLDDNGLSEYDKERIIKFNDKIRVEIGSKYTKIFTGSSIWGFIVNENDTVKNIKSGNYFSKGDLLKAASYKAPARNFARGNIRLGNMVKTRTPEYPDFRVVWTSAV
tara:strand:+ start:4144 stop:4572 length:429 start_codon:yes stop_codon:yes gene_type:complete